MRNARLFVKPQGLRKRAGGVPKVPQQLGERAQTESVFHVLLRASSAGELAQGTQVRYLRLRPGNE